MLKLRDSVQRDRQHVLGRRGPTPPHGATTTVAGPSSTDAGTFTGASTTQRSPTSAGDELGPCAAAAATATAATHATATGTNAARLNRPRRRLGGKGEIVDSIG